MNPSKRESEVEVYVTHPPPNAKDDPSPTGGAEMRKSCFHIDKEMVRYKLHFFLFVGGLSLTCPYFSVFAKNRLGLSATALATILTTQEILFIFTKPMIGYIADYFNKLKAVIVILAVTQGVVYFSLLAIPKINSGEDLSSAPLFHFDQSTKGNEICPFNSLNRTHLTDSTITDKKIEVLCARGLPEYPNISNDCVLTVIEAHIANESQKSPPLQGKDTDQHFLFEQICRGCCAVNDNCYALACTQVNTSSESTFSRFKESQYISASFWLFAFFGTLTMACINALFTLSDTALCETCQKAGADFGKQRLWGAIGWGVMAPIGGLLNDITNDYLASFLIMGVFTALSLWNLYKMDVVKPQFSQNILKDVGRVLSSGEFLLFEIGVLINGAFLGVIWYYLVWFLTTIGGSEFLWGIVLAVQCFFGEVPFMFFSGYIIKKLGHFNVLTLALFGYCVRFLWYSFLEDPWLVLPVEVLHGLTFGVVYPNIASYAKKSAEPGTEATTQSILFSTHEGLGGALGCVLAGIGFDQLGGHQTFFLAGICAACGMVLNIVFTLFLHKKSCEKTTVVVQ